MSKSGSELFYSSLERLSDPIDTEQLASEAVDLGIEAQLLDFQVDGATWSGMPHDNDPIADEAYAVNYRRQVAERGQNQRFVKSMQKTYRYCRVVSPDL